MKSGQLCEPCNPRWRFPHSNSTSKKRMTMSTPSTSLKTSTSIRIDADLLSQIRAEAKAEHRSLSNYLETLLYRWGYRPYNQATFEACESARTGAYAGTIDTHSDEAFVASILGDEND